MKKQPKSRRVSNALKSKLTSPPPTIRTSPSCSSQSPHWVPFNEREDVTTEMVEYQLKIKYSERYANSIYEYRHVILPKTFYELHVHPRFKDRLLNPEEWRHIGICQSNGW